MTTAHRNTFRTRACRAGRLAACLGVLAGVPATAAVGSGAQVAFGALAFTPCTLAAAGQAVTLAARCASLQVPEDRSRPDARSIELAIAWVPSTSKSPAAEPVLFLAGGPGQSAL